MIIDQLKTLSAQAKRLVLMRFLVYTGFQSSYYVGVIGSLTYADGATVASTSLAVVLMNAFFILGSFVGGSALDAWGPRRHYFASTVAIVATGAFLFAFGGAQAVLFLGAALMGFLMGCTQVVFTSYPVYLTSDAGELQTINSVITTLSNVSVVLGPLAGGALSAAFGSLAVFPFMAAFAVAGLVTGLGFHPLVTPQKATGDGADKTVDAVDGATSGPTFVDSVRYVATHGLLSLMFWVIFLANFGYGAFDPLESFFYRDVLHVSVDWMGWLSAASGVGGVLGALAVMRLPKQRVGINTLLVALIFMGAGSLVYVGTPFVAVAFVGQIAVGIGWGAVTPLHSTLVQTNAPMAMMGRVNSVMTFGSMVAGVAPLAVAPWLASVFGVQQTLIGAAATVVAVPLVILAFRRIRAK